MKNALRTIMLAVAATVALTAISQAATVASFQSVKGKVELKKDDKGSWASAKAGLPIAEGAEVRTGSGAEAIIRWKQGHIVKLSAMSNFKVEKLKVDDDDASESTNLNVRAGKIFVKTKKLMSKSSEFTVKTPTAVAGVRGTEFMVSVVEESGASTVALLSGELDVAGDMVETILQDNMQIDIVAGAETAPAPVELDPGTQQEMQGEFQNLDTMLETAPPPTTESDTGTAAPSAEEAVEAIDIITDTVDEIIDKAVIPVEPETPDTGKPDVPPMPPDR